MSTIKKILVPTDFSTEANNALAVAVEIADRINAEITLLHIVDIPYVGHEDNLGIMGYTEDHAENPAFYKLYMEKLMETTKGRIQALKDQYPHSTIKEHVVFDSFQKHMAKFVVKDQTDLIVIGSKGASGIDEVFVGSNTEKVIRYSKVPVLTVKHYPEGFDPRKIVFASNFKKVPEKTITALKSFQEIFMAELVFVKIITPNTFETTPDTLNLINEFAKSHGFEDYKAEVFNYFTEEEGIRAFGHEISADIMAMSTHGRTGISHLLFGSIAEEVANHASIPVLTFNDHFNEKED
ncbi:universal stress protein [Chondrinema litorale]|uniref:universal stress protein n=1 Tax=Chondrinema litorale TaxID=2994555 RepID=UPI002542747F|nr:universal stress protein [Chondrinema litorale]UZR93545.1 universal stress protein [Chondrinema litorale]